MSQTTPREQKYHGKFNLFPQQIFREIVTIFSKRFQHKIHLQKQQKKKKNQQNKQKFKSLLNT